MKLFGWETVQVILNQLFVDDLLRILFYYFDKRITLRNVEIISIKVVGEASCRYQPYGEGANSLFEVLDQRDVAEMEQYTYSQLPITYRTVRTTLAALFIC